MEDDETKLASLLYTGGAMDESPKSTTYATKHFQLIIAIGKNHTATITIDEESMKELCKRKGYSMQDFIEA